jgi:hypothetical protein
MCLTDEQDEFLFSYYRTDAWNDCWGDYVPGREAAKEETSAASPSVGVVARFLAIVGIRPLPNPASESQEATGVSSSLWDDVGDALNRAAPSTSLNEDVTERPADEGMLVGGRR